MANIIVDENGKPVAEDLWYGITPAIEKMILEEQNLSTAKPDALQQEADSKTEEHSTNKSAKPENYLKNAEEYQEENYDCIDGRMSRQNKLTHIRNSVLPFWKNSMINRLKFLSAEKARSPQKKKVTIFLFNLTS